MRKLFLLFALITTVTVFLAGCGASNDKEVRLGATSGPHAEIAEEVAKEAAKQGIKVKVVEFSDYVTPDKALADGDVDIVGYQHQPYLNNFNKQNGTDLVPVNTSYLMPMGIYSDKIKNLKDLPDGASIAIPNDPSNGGRALKLLQVAGLIKLNPNVSGFKATVKDITENPHHYKIVELDAAQLPRSLSDIDAAAVTMNYAMSGGLDVHKQGLFFEDKNEPLAIVVTATKKEHKDDATIQKVAEIYHSEAVKQFINDKYKGSIVPAEPKKF